MKNWIIAAYKSNQIKTVKTNMSNQDIEYYLPVITTKKINSSVKKEVLFPGYIFININPDQYPLVKYTKGIKKLLHLETALHI